MMEEPKYVFDADNIRFVREVVVERPLGLALDLDGTISEIAPEPCQAIVAEAIKQQLANLASKLSLVATISGRPAAECRKMIGNDNILYLGNHGLERWRNNRIEVRSDVKQYERVVAASLDEIARQLSIEGLLFENKGVVGAIHYRNTLQPEMARAAILLAISKSSTTSQLKITEGKMVVELRPPVEIDKGTTVRELVEEFRLQGILYAGDDLTDVDAFLALHHLQEEKKLKTLSIAVLSAETPRKVLASADLALRGVSEVEKLLIWISHEVGAASHS